MATVYLTEHGSVAHKVDERIVVKQHGRVLADIPLLKVDAVRVVGASISLTTPLLMYLMDHGIETVFLSAGQRFRGRLSGGLSAHGALRTAQVHAAEDGTRALAQAGAVVRGKLINQRFLLRRHGAADEAVQQAMEAIKAMIERAATAPSLDVLRGYEGQAAASYFAGLRRLFQQDLGFERRIQHPPTDPVNSLLSFGYTLLLNDLISAVQLVGLDPYIGFFHALAPGRPSLALDLEEEFRPVVVDVLVLQLVNSGTIRARDFRTADDPAGAVLLSDGARKLYLQAYAERLETAVRYPPTDERATYRRLLELQARALARTLQSRQPYVAFAAQ